MSELTPEMLKWAIGTIGACTVAIIGAVVWLATLVFRIGQKYGAVESEIASFKRAVNKLESSHERLGRIDVLETKLEQVIDSHAEERRRFASDFPEMQSKVTALWERVFSLQQWRKSQGQYGE